MKEVIDQHVTLSMPAQLCVPWQSKSIGRLVENQEGLSGDIGGIPLSLPGRSNLGPTGLRVSQSRKQRHSVFREQLKKCARKEEKASGGWQMG